MLENFDFPKLFNDEIFKYFLLGCNGFAIFIWIVTLITKNISHMDRLWGILPNVYSGLFLYTAIHFNPKESTRKYSILKSDDSSISRLMLMSGLMLMWGARIVYVFWRRGYYRLDYEDHRWEFLKEKLNYPARKVPFHLFNFIFQGFVQNWILIGHALPMWYIQTNNSSGRISMQQPLNVADLILAGFFVIFFLCEYVADEQQWNFQSKKIRMDC